MANCHQLFQAYHEDISICDSKKERLIKSKAGLRDRIRRWFRDNHPDYDPKFFIQGSHKMKTGIRTKDDICDLDDGVYFLRQPDVTATTLQGWVKDAVTDYTNTPPEHKKKCIRSVFAGDYEIDQPVYCKVDGKPYQLAVKNVGFEYSDPKEMVDWFRGKKDPEGKLVRQVKYLKGWCDNIGNWMPCGLAMTILASNAKSKIVLNDRDDITLRDILREMKKALNPRFECIVPAVPHDDLFSDYDDSRKKAFLDALDEFLNDADSALLEKNQLKASKLWRNHLGDRFPEGEDEEDVGNASLSSSIAVGAATSRPWANV